jgi:hypothetical protein
MAVSKRKRYLTGSDWAINTLDHMMKRSTCSGNMSQIVLMLNAEIHADELRLKLDHFVKQFPVLHGYIKRDIKLAPYWKIPRSDMQDTTLRITDFTGPDYDTQFMSALSESADRPFRDEREHVAFHLIKGPDRCALAMAFDHRIFDARGAESFLNLFNRSLSEKLPSGDIAFISSAQLSNWKRKFLAGRNVNRRLISMSKSPPRTLPLTAETGKGFIYRLISFNEKETSKLYENAYKAAGYLMDSPFFLAIITMAAHDVIKQVSCDGSSYVIPVTVDSRGREYPLQDIFFNHLSYLFYQIPVAQAENRNELISIFKQQMYEQVKTGFPKDLAEASLLSRIAPLGVFGRIMHIPLKGRVASFAFSSLGKSSYESDKFMGAPVANLFHMPRVPAPPGLGFFSNYYRGKFNIVISCLEGLLSEDKLRILESGVRNGLGVSST